MVAEIHDLFERATGVVLTQYKGLTVEEMTGFRDNLRTHGVQYRVVKNTLASIAAEGTSIEVAKDYFTGPVGVAISYDDPAPLCKETLAFAKENETLKVMGGVIDGVFYEIDGLKKIADLPSRDVMLSMMAGTFQAPTSMMARLLQATVVKFAYAMHALKEKKEAA
jgi:large subunit ribosomal protein L10